MGTPHWSMCFALGLALFLFAAATLQGAIGPQNVLVLYNTASADGIELANYYNQVHPGVQTLGINVTTDVQVTDDYYLNTIRPQILNSGKLTSSIDVIVTTKGLPLRINVDDPNPGTYTDPFGVARTVRSGWWRTYSSLESELTRIDMISTPEQMGDQSIYTTYGPPTIPSKNPYYLPYDYWDPITKKYVHVISSAPFDTSTNYDVGYGGMRLAARLDGFTVNDVKTAINRAQQAFLISNSRWVVVDNDPAPRATADIELITNLKDLLILKGQAHVYNEDNNAITQASGPVIGYVSHGTNDMGTPQDGSLDSGYIQSQLQFSLADGSLVNGAVFHTHESFNAYSFQPGGNKNVDGVLQGLVAEWLAIGGTAGVGNVEEPQSYRDNEANEDQMFKMLLEGYTWAEAAWSSIKQLSYVNTVVGDPLMIWKQVIPGDANLDGLVGSADLARLGANWGTTGQTGGYRWSKGDFNADGLVGSADLARLGANWGKRASWAGGGSALAAGPLDMEAFLASVPEPTAMNLVLTGLFTLMVGYGWRRFRHIVFAY